MKTLKTVIGLILMSPIFLLMGITSFLGDCCSLAANLVFPGSGEDA